MYALAFDLDGRQHHEGNFLDKTGFGISGLPEQQPVNGDEYHRSQKAKDILVTYQRIKWELNPQENYYENECQGENRQYQC